MIIKFKATTMLEYKGSDGNGGSVHLVKDQTAEVADAIGKILVRRYSRDFTQVEEAPRLVADGDKQINAQKKRKLRLKVK